MPDIERRSERVGQRGVRGEQREEKRWKRQRKIERGTDRRDSFL